jgi:hypothetical protein
MNTVLNYIGGNPGIFLGLIIILVLVIIFLYLKTKSVSSGFIPYNKKDKNELTPDKSVENEEELKPVPIVKTIEKYDKDIVSLIQSINTYI